MTNDPEKLHQTIGTYLADQAGDDESAWLAARLGESPADLDTFIDTLLVEAGLIELGQDGGLDAMRTPALPWWRRPGWISLGSAAALVAITAWVLAQFAAPKPPPFASWTTSPGSHVAVTAAGEAAGELTPGSILRVNQGCAEVRIAAGVRCLVQAPGTLHLISENRVAFRDGVARFHVGPEAHGFEVLAGDLQIIDLGTEFGIDSRGSHRGEVHVITGAVQVTSRSGRKETVRVDAGHAVALGPVGKVETTLYEPERFLDTLPTGIPALHFDFEPTGEGTVEARGLIARRDGVRLAPGADGTARVMESDHGGVLRLNGDGYVATNWPGIGGTSPRTIAFRIRIDPGESEHPATPILGWGNFRNPRTMSGLAIRTVEGSGTIRIVSGQRWLQGKASIADGQWHHVAIVLGQHRPGSWPQTRLFIDGHEDTLIPGEPWNQPKARLDTFFTDVHHPHSQPLTLGRYNVGTGKTYLPDMRGEIDDLIIAEGSLGADQVRALHDGRLDDSGLDVF